MSELVNLRIDQHPLGNPQPGDFGIYRDIVNGVTKKFDFTPFITSSTDNFEWSSTEATANNYDIGDVVTYSGNWYQSAVNNNQSIPGVNSDWTLITKSPSGLVYWQAGVYTEEKVFVVSEHSGKPEIYFLSNEIRPFVSSNIATEEAGASWISVTRSVWGEITGDITDQTDLINYIDSIVVDFAFRNYGLRIVTTSTTVDGTIDKRAILIYDGGTDINVTVPSLQSGFNCIVVRTGAGRITFVPDSITLNTSSGGFLDGGKNYLNRIIGQQSGTVQLDNGKFSVISVNTTQTGNVGTGEDTLFSYSLPAGTLAANKDSIVIFSAGNTAANTNTKTLKLKFGGTTIVDTGAQVVSDTSWIIKATIIRTGATSQKCIGEILMGSVFVNFETASETLSGAITILITGEATSNNDIVGEMFKVKFEASE